ncbi:hypothetical protein SAMN05443549_105253 [Flavobacterium fluvii]|uniref:Uncharacterized protein n=1 Tax=Flavobacterium fluvii TaxID=468056 RepID=A0A1M5LL06_9FLAO|nr:hypothetical protein [Flavobacterium fluvii]SHG65717.1 hypothetical protein SAMN05443549_105253 [Flavobacterium fluvii]
MKKLIITPFLIVIGALEILLLIMSVYFLLIDNNGGKALGGAIAFIGFIIFIVIILIEQSILNFRKFNKEKVWLLESVILIIVAIYIYLNGISIG